MDNSGIGWVLFAMTGIYMGTLQLSQSSNQTVEVVPRKTETHQALRQAVLRFTLNTHATLSNVYGYAVTNLASSLNNY